MSMPLSGTDVDLAVGTLKLANAPIGTSPPGGEVGEGVGLLEDRLLLDAGPRFGPLRTTAVGPWPRRSLRAVRGGRGGRSGDRDGPRPRPRSTSTRVRAPRPWSRSTARSR